jgi:glycosyltransferase involved in cell wall biosynthesis
MWPALAAKLLVGSRVVYDSHELWPDRNGRWERRPWLLASEALFTRAADAVVTASPGYSCVMARRYRIPTPAVVRNVPLAAAAPGREPSSPLAVYVGAVIPGRGLEQAVDAVALVDGLRLRIIGPGAADAVDALHRRARAAGAGDRVEIVPPVAAAAVVAALDGASVGLNLIEPICLSYQLTLPNKLFEYIAAGVPVLTSDVPVCARFVREHGVGEVVALGDPRRVAAALERLLEPARAADLRARARSLSRELTWEREQPRLAAVYAAAAR